MIAGIIATMFGVVLVLARVVYAGNAAFVFLIWNVCLAWIPFVVASRLAARGGLDGLLSWLIAAVWLLFFPNAPYILTDFFHLSWRASSSVPLWYDAVMIAAFAWTGLLLGTASLALMQGVVRRRFGTMVGWIFAMASLVVGSMGVWLGRYARWNSWDVFADPGGVVNDVTTRMLDPFAHPGALGMTVVLATFLVVVYLTATLVVRETNPRAERS